MILENPLKGARAKRPVIIFLHGFGRNALNAAQTP